MKAHYKSRELVFSHKATVIANGGKEASTLKKSYLLLKKLKTYDDSLRLTIGDLRLTINLWFKVFRNHRIVDIVDMDVALLPDDISNYILSFLYPKIDTLNLRSHCYQDYKLYLSLDSLFTDDNIMINKRRRDEIFFNSTGLYVYPWLSNNNYVSLTNFVGFKQFVTSGYFFDADLIKGIDQVGMRFKLIKEDMQFYPSQQIVAIEFNPNTTNYSDYEKIMFDEFKKLILFVDSLSEQDKPKQLYYHLPCYDYMLIGIELFINGRMTLPALNQFLEIIISKSIKHMDQITKICADHQIECKFESPFENLFGNLQQLNNHNAATILEEISAGTFIIYCLQKLQTNHINQTHQQIWQDLVNINALEYQINDVYDLCKIANIMVTLLASRGEQDYSTCSLLTIAEKHAQVTHAKFCKKHNISNYPAVFNLTTINPMDDVEDPANTDHLSAKLKNCCHI